VLAVSEIGEAAEDNDIITPAHTLTFGVDRTGIDGLTIDGAFCDVDKTLEG
jgi:hypothetical protein